MLPRNRKDEFAAKIRERTLLGYDEWDALKSEKSPYSSGVILFFSAYTLSLVITVAELMTIASFSLNVEALYLLGVFGFGALSGCFALLIPKLRGFLAIAIASMILTLSLTFQLFATDHSASFMPYFVALIVGLQFGLVQVGSRNVLIHLRGLFWYNLDEKYHLGGVLSPISVALGITIATFLTSKVVVIVCFSLAVV